MACCLTAPSHYLNQCWLIISEVLWHLPENNFTGNVQDTYHWYESEKLLIQDFSSNSQGSMSSLHVPVFPRYAMPWKASLDPNGWTSCVRHLQTGWETRQDLWGITEETGGHCDKLRPGGTTYRLTAANGLTTTNRITATYRPTGTYRLTRTYRLTGTCGITATNRSVCRWVKMHNIDGLVQDCGISIALAMEIPSSCTKQSVCPVNIHMFACLCLVLFGLYGPCMIVPHKWTKICWLATAN